MARYGQAFKDNVVAKLLPPESASLQQVSLQTGVSESTLERWLSEALAQPSKTQEWTPAARFDALLTTAAMDEQSKNEWCRSHGVYPQELEQWKLQAQQGLSGDGAAALQNTRKQDRKLIQSLERELRRKEKALAETAALLVLSKKLEAMMREDGEE